MNTLILLLFLAFISYSNAFSYSKGVYLNSACTWLVDVAVATANSTNPNSNTTVYGACQYSNTVMKWVLPQGQFPSSGSLGEPLKGFCNGVYGVAVGPSRDIYGACPIDNTLMRWGCDTCVGVLFADTSCTSAISVAVSQSTGNIFAACQSSGVIKMWYSSPTVTSTPGITLTTVSSCNSPDKVSVSIFGSLVASCQSSNVIMYWSSFSAPGVPLNTSCYNPQSASISSVTGAISGSCSDRILYWPSPTAASALVLTTQGGSCINQWGQAFLPPSPSVTTDTLYITCQVLSVIKFTNFTSGVGTLLSTSGSCNAATGLAVSANNDVFIACTNNLIGFKNALGTSVTFPGACGYVYSTAVDSVTGHVYVGCEGSNAVFKYANGVSQSVILSGVCLQPYHMVIVSKGDLAVACTSSNYVSVYSNNVGTPLTGQGCNSPKFVAFAPSSGDIFAVCSTAIMRWAGGVGSGSFLSNTNGIFCTNPVSLAIELSTSNLYSICDTTTVMVWYSSTGYSTAYTINNTLSTPLSVYSPSNLGIFVSTSTGIFYWTDPLASPSLFIPSSTCSSPKMISGILVDNADSPFLYRNNYLSGSSKLYLTAICGFGISVFDLSGNLLASSSGIVSPFATCVPQMFGMNNNTGALYGACLTAGILSWSFVPMTYSSSLTPFSSSRTPYSSSFTPYSSSRISYSSSFTPYSSSFKALASSSQSAFSSSALPIPVPVCGSLYSATVNGVSTSLLNPGVRLNSLNYPSICSSSSAYPNAQYVCNVMNAVTAGVFICSNNISSVSSLSLQSQPPLICNLNGAWSSNNLFCPTINSTSVVVTSPACQPARVSFNLNNINLILTHNNVPFTDLNLTAAAQNYIQFVFASLLNVDPNRFQVSVTTSVVTSVLVGPYAQSSVSITILANNNCLPPSASQIGNELYYELSTNTSAIYSTGLGIGIIPGSWTFSLVDLVASFFGISTQTIIIIAGVVAILLVLLYAVHRFKYPQANIMAFFTFLISLVSTLSIVAFILAIRMHSVDVDDPFLYFLSNIDLIALAISLVVNFLLGLVLLAKESKFARENRLMAKNRMAQKLKPGDQSPVGFDIWLNNHSGLAAIVTIFASCDVLNLELLGCKLFYLDTFGANFSRILNFRLNISSCVSLITINIAHTFISYLVSNKYGDNNPIALVVVIISPIIIAIKLIKLYFLYFSYDVETTDTDLEDMKKKKKNGKEGQDEDETEPEPGREVGLTVANETGPTAQEGVVKSSHKKSDSEGLELVTTLPQPKVTSQPEPTNTTQAPELVTNPLVGVGEI